MSTEPFSSDETFEYEASPAGTYVYHSHVGLQLDRGLYGPLIVEEESTHVDHVEYDHEYTLQFDENLGEEPALDLIEAPPGGGDGIGPSGGPRGDGNRRDPGDGDGRGGGRGPGNGMGPGQNDDETGPGNGMESGT